MKKRSTILGLALLLPVLCWAQRQTQGGRPKGSDRAAKETQIVEPMLRTQGQPGQRIEDQTVVYRFRLAPAEFGSDLVLTNVSMTEGEFKLVAQQADGSVLHEVTTTVGPGETLRIPSAEAHWSASGRVLVKASRRLRLTLHSPGSSGPRAIELHRSAATYDVFSLERQWEVPAVGQKRRVELLTSGKRFSKSLAGRESLPQAVLGLWNARDSAEPRGLFVTYTAR